MSAFADIKKAVNQWNQNALPSISTIRRKYESDVGQLIHQISDHSVKRHLSRLVPAGSWTEYEKAEKLEKQVRKIHERYELTRLADLSYPLDRTVDVSSSEWKKSHEEALDAESIYLACMVSHDSTYSYLNTASFHDFRPPEILEHQLNFAFNDVKQSEAKLEDWMKVRKPTLNEGGELVRFSDMHGWSNDKHYVERIKMKCLLHNEFERVSPTLEKKMKSDGSKLPDFEFYAYAILLQLASHIQSSFEAPDLGLRAKYKTLSITKMAQVIGDILDDVVSKIGSSFILEGTDLGHSGFAIANTPVKWIDIFANGDVTFDVASLRLLLFPPNIESISSSAESN